MSSGGGVVVRESCRFSTWYVEGMEVNASDTVKGVEFRQGAREPLVNEGR